MVSQESIQSLIGYKKPTGCKEPLYYCKQHPNFQNIHLKEIKRHIASKIITVSASTVAVVVAVKKYNNNRNIHYNSKKNKNKNKPVSMKKVLGNFPTR